MRILWVGIFFSLVAFYLYSRIREQPRDAEPNSTLTLIFIAAALLAIPVSFLIKNAFLKQSVERQQPQLVQQGYVIALAINEAGALLGLVDLLLK